MKRIFLQKKQNKTILELLREQGEYLDAPCSGKGTCGKCCIIIEETRKTDPPKQREKEVFTERELEEGWRLSCMTVPTDDLYVCIPEIRENQIQVQMEFVRNTKMESDVQATTVICENKIEDRAQIGSDGEIKPENMDTEKSVYGIAIDIGTTTLAAELISLTDGICLKTASSVNHQRAYGADVISRIRAAASGDAEKLRESILKDVRNLAETAACGAGRKCAECQQNRDRRKYYNDSPFTGIFLCGAWRCTIYSCEPCAGGYDVGRIEW